jgi:hypothetical protein
LYNHSSTNVIKKWGMNGFLSLLLRLLKPVE